MYHPTTRPQEGYKGSPIAREILGYWEVIRKIVRECDIIIEVLDARMPEFSRNGEIEAIVLENKKRLIFVMNKADLVSEGTLERESDELKKVGECVYVSSKSDVDLKKLKALIFKDFTKVTNEFEKLRIGIVGYPNTGKSSLINKLTHRRSARVSKRAGTTHGVQWIRFGENAVIMDSPGVIPLSGADFIQEGLLGAKDPERLPNPEFVAHKLIEMCQLKNEKSLRDFLQIEVVNKNPDKIIDEVAIKKSFVRKGGLPDRNRAIIFLLRSWTRGELRV